MGTRGLIPGGKAAREADHSPRSSAEVKECVELYLHSPNAFMAWCLVKHRDSFTFTFYLIQCNSYTILVGKPEGKRPLGRPRRRWEDTTVDLREIV